MLFHIQEWFFFFLQFMKLQLDKYFNLRAWTHSFSESVARCQPNLLKRAKFMSFNFQMPKNLLQL